MGKNYIIGIDLGGTKINSVLSDLQGNVISQCTIFTEAFKGEQIVLNRIMDTIDKVLQDSNKTIEEVRAIGIGSPGPLNSKEGIIITTPNLPFKNFNIVNPIINKYRVPTYLDNDANAASMGELLFGAGKGTENMIYVTVSTGIGGGGILNGRLYRGNTYNALEIGHMTVEPNGPKCNCGNYGCAEAVSSGTAIARQGKEAVEKGEKTSLSNYKNITAFEVFKEAENGDLVSNNIIKKSLNYLGICISNIITSFDPEMIIIGGGVTKAGDIVFKSVREVVDSRCFKTMAESCKIVPPKLGGDAGVMGAVALALIEEGIKL
ncbi:ROK family protein [uncultured Clostridium sp.]|uniref:ROK family protein n=1 Tax=uncultured Clostridium sp. TaxID=59620 RepID=UPI0028E51BA9|nr:ROK family protein [uncultured Clostridium sp.]